MPLIFETIQENKSVLVFCATKAACEKTCTQVARYMNIKCEDLVLEQRKNVIIELEKCPVGLDPILSGSVIRGVAYHHSVKLFRDLG